MSKEFHVLLVNGEPSFAAEVVDCFAQSGFRVDVARDGPRGLAMALVGGYSTIIVDVVLEGFDGFSLLEALRRQIKVPVLMLSRPLRIVPGEKSPVRADDYLPRPCTAAALLERVRTLVSAGARPASVV